jgi:DNA-binding Lrp family transcriptional regulator
MSEGSEKLDGLSYRLLMEYLKDSSRSEGQIAKVLGVSQPTVSKLKSKLLTSGIVRHFSAIPALSKIGYEILAFSLIKFNTENVMNNWAEVTKMAKDWMQKHPEIIFDSRAEGMGVDAINISVHKDYAAYKEFLAQSKLIWGKFFSEMNYILVDIQQGINKPLSFKYLADEPEK